MSESIMKVSFTGKVCSSIKKVTCTKVNGFTMSKLDLDVTSGSRETPTQECGRTIAERARFGGGESDFPFCLIYILKIGELKWANGDLYCGEWSDNRRTGIGVLRWYCVCS